MASDKNTVSFIVDQLSLAGDVSARPMFGEYGLYREGRMFGMICDDQLFIKPTAGGRAFAGDVGEGSPYPGAKPCLLIDADRWDDGDWLAELVRITTVELPLPNRRRRAGRRQADPHRAILPPAPTVLRPCDRGRSLHRNDRSGVVSS